MRAAAMRCCASKRSTSTRSEAGGDATPKAGIESGVAARAGAHSISIRVVDSEDESRAPRGWPGGTDPCSSDDGGARTSTSAFAEGCVAVDADAVARSIATELLMTRTSDRRDVFSVRRSGTVSAMDTDVEIDLEAGNGGAVSCGDTVTEPDENTRLLAGAAAAAYSSLPSSSDEDAKSSRHRRDRDERSDLSRATTSTRDYGVNTDLSDDGVTRRRPRTEAAREGGGHARDGGAAHRVRRRGMRVVFAGSVAVVRGERVPHLHRANERSSWRRE